MKSSAARSAILPPQYCFNLWQKYIFGIGWDVHSQLQVYSVTVGRCLAKRRVRYCSKFFGGDDMSSVRKKSATGSKEDTLHLSEHPFNDLGCKQGVWKHHTSGHRFLVVFYGLVFSLPCIGPDTPILHFSLHTTLPKSNVSAHNGMDLQA